MPQLVTDHCQDIELAYCMAADAAAAALERPTPDDHELALVLGTYVFVSMTLQDQMAMPADFLPATAGRGLLLSEVLESGLVCAGLPIDTAAMVAGGLIDDDDFIDDVLDLSYVEPDDHVRGIHYDTKDRWVDEVDFVLGLVEQVPRLVDFLVQEDISAN